MSNRVQTLLPPHGLSHTSVSADSLWMPQASVERGPVRITGTVLGGGVSWHVTTDNLGWTTVVLVSEPFGPRHTPKIRKTLSQCAEYCASPSNIANALASTLGPIFATHTGLGIVRIGPNGRMVETMNVSLPTVLHWDTCDGLLPIEPCARGVRGLSDQLPVENARLHAGSAIVLTTSGVLSHHADWCDLSQFSEALGLDTFGALLADAPPEELSRLLRDEWGVEARMNVPTGMVVIGLPGGVANYA